MTKYAFIVDHDYCTGCLSCEIACQQENDYPPGKSGVFVRETEYEITGKLRIDFLPVFTDACTLCAQTLKEYKLPSCVRHCQARCIEFCDVTEVLERADKYENSIIYIRKIKGKVASSQGDSR